MPQGKVTVVSRFETALLLLTGLALSLAAAVGPVLSGLRPSDARNLRSHAE
jgi:hypothetical protein